MPMTIFSLPTGDNKDADYRCNKACEGNGDMYRVRQRKDCSHQNEHDRKDE